MKILVTGAHFTPAYATIEELKKFPEVELVYVGRKTTLEGDPSSTSVESQVLPKLGVKFISLIAGRLQRTFTLYTIPSFLKIPIGFIQAIYIILMERPDVILSFGGYVALPAVVIGWLFSIPIMLHEQTLSLGLSNKISSYFADKIALSFKQGGFDQKRAILVGNPIRNMIKEDFRILGGGLGTIFKQAKKEKLPVILITGGNQGSHTINRAVESILRELTTLSFIVHVTGDNKFKDFEKLQNLGTFDGRYKVEKWIGEEYGALLHWVDLVVSRAGINTLTELAYVGKPALVIPFEPLYKQEQVRNARFFQKAGLVKVLPQSKLTPKSLLENINPMIKNLDQLKQKAADAKKVIIPDAAKRLALEAVLLAKRR